MKKIHTPMRSSIGNQETKMVIRKESFCTSLTLMSTPDLRRIGKSSRSDMGKMVWKGLPSESTPLMVSPLMVTRVIALLSMLAMNSL